MPIEADLGRNAQYRAVGCSPEVPPPRCRSWSYPPPGGKAAAWLCGLTTLRPGNPYEGEQSWFRYLTSEVKQVFRRFHEPVATEAGRDLLVGIFRKKVVGYG
jgi:hypothetical protein